MLINVDKMKRDDDRVVSTPGCCTVHQLIGDRARCRSARRRVESNNTWSNYYFGQRSVTMC